MRGTTTRAARTTRAVLLAFAIAGTAQAKILVTTEDAVREAFGGAPAEKHTDYLDEAQAAAIAKQAGSAPSSRIVISYRASRDGRPLGVAYLESHVVRTLPETILVVLDPDAKVVKVEILSFDEPDQYRPRERWMDQFKGRTLDSELSLSKGIRGVTGATLSSRAITAAVRRVLATHAVLSAAARPAAQRPRNAPEAPAPPKGDVEANSASARKMASPPPKGAP